MLDWGLAAEALNKVDAGVPEKVGSGVQALAQLSRDGPWSACSALRAGCTRVVL